MVRSATVLGDRSFEVDKEELDRKSRKMITMRGAVKPKSDVIHLYLSREDSDML